MDYQTWKEKIKDDDFPSVSRKQFEKLQQEYDFRIVKHHEKVGRCFVEGVCYTPTCKNNYIKVFQTMSKCGPYCNLCMGRRGLLVDEFPHIAKSIISNVDLTKLTSSSEKKMDFQCPERCSRCKKQHVWNAMIYKRTSRGDGCTLCSGNSNCSCIKKEVEFCCCRCKEIKPLKYKCGTKNLCTLCKRKEYDGSLKKFMKYLFRTTSQYIKNEPRKRGDISLEYLKQLYEIQEGKCYISGIPMKAGKHQDWKMSIERLDESIGYMNNNIVLICCEFQSGHRQHTIERWDLICHLVKGNLENLPDETDYLNQYVKHSKIYNYNTPKKRRQTNEDGQTKCNVCDCWLHADCYTKNSETICAGHVCQRRINYVLKQ